MSDELVVTPAEPPEYETGRMKAEILGVEKKHSEWTDEDGNPRDGDFLSLRLGLENGENTTIDYPWADPPRSTNMMGRLLDRFEALDPGQDVDIRSILKGRKCSIHVTAAEDRDGDHDFADFDKTTLEPLDE